jgi:hypothetical protein
MVVFLTLFLGLAAGLQPLELQVDDSVYRLEIVLDGEIVGGIVGEPWLTRVDLGNDLLPHLLEAVAFDAAGIEIGRVRQAINRPRDPAEASMLLIGGAQGRGVTAQLHWRSIFATEPSSIHVSFDGLELLADAAGRIALPDHDPDQLHFLRAEVDFTESVRSLTEIAFGGIYTDEVNTELTAVPVVLDEEATLPSADHLQGWFLADGRPLTVVAVEEGPAEVVVVVDQETLPRLELLDRNARAVSRGAGPGGRLRRQRMTPLRQETILRFITPFIEDRGSHRNTYDLFPRSPDLDPREGGFFWHLIHHLPRPGAGPQRLADAVAVAAMSAAHRNRRRAVVLLTSDRPEDQGRFRAVDVRGYLQAMSVPLAVWRSTKSGETLNAVWGASSRVTTVARLEKEVLHLVRNLERQRIVWLGGDHLPQSISLSPTARGVRLAN